MGLEPAGGAWRRLFVIVDRSFVATNMMKGA
jgi:hypothetical protein